MNKHGGYYGKEKLQDRSINVNPLGTPELLLQVLEEELKGLAPYPTLDAREGREALSQWLGVDKAQLLLGNGAISLLYLYARAKRFDKVLLIDPSFNEYERAFRLAGSEMLRLILEKPFIPQVKAILQKAKEEEVDLVVLCHPCNPTGVLLSREEIEELYQQLDIQGIELFLDESFLDFTTQEALSPRKGLFQLRSLTKFYALAGLRLGYGIGEEETISSMISSMEPWSVNHLAEKAAMHLGELQDYEKKTLHLINQEREKILEKLDTLGIWHSRSSTNFVLIEIQDPLFLDKMKEKGYYLRQCGDFTGLSEHYYRFCIGLEKQNQGFLQALEECL